MAKVRVAVVMGGPSSEREVSIESGQAVLQGAGDARARGAVAGFRRPLRRRAARDPARRRVQRAARQRRRRRHDPRRARVAGHPLHRQRPDELRARDGQASDEEAARGRRPADARLGHLRPQRRHAAAAARLAQPAAGREAARRRIERRRLDRAHARGVDQSDDRRGAQDDADPRRGVRPGARVLERAFSARRRCRWSRSSRATSSTPTMPSTSRAARATSSPRRSTAT